MMKRILVAASLLIAIAACNTATINTPTRTFDRPSDVSLSCVLFDPSKNNRVWNVLPIESCSQEIINDASQLNSLSPFHKQDPTDTTNTLYYYPELRAAVVNSARGELALVDLQRNFIVDLEPAVPGFGFLPVGALPEHVRSTHDGCLAVTANVDSCDLAMVDIPTALNIPVTSGRDGGTGTNGLIEPPGFADHVVQRINLTVNGKPLHARPTWLELGPESVDGKSGWTNGPVGQCAGGSYSVWVALPGCQLIVEAELSATEAKVKQAVRITRAGAEVVSDLSTISCPVECDGVAASDMGAPPPPADAGATDGGVGRLPDSQAFPSTISIDTENGAGRMFIGDYAGESVYIVPLDPTQGKVGTPRKITLEAGALGVQVLRVSPRSEAGKFLYAVARDLSVRVVDLDREVECETNPDPRSPLLGPLPDIDPQLGARSLGCFPLGDPATPPRSPLAITPGIMLQNGAIPRDVTFVHLNVAPPPVDPATGLTDTALAPPPANSTQLVGDFAWLVSSDGRGTLIDIYDACPAPNLELNPNGPFTPACAVANAQCSREVTANLPGRPAPLGLDRQSHRTRSASNRFLPPTNCGDTSGAPRLQDESHPFTFTINGTTSALNPDGGVGASAASLVTELLPIPAASAACAPYLVNFTAGSCTSSTQRSIAFYDIDHTRNETWNLAWEGVIPATQRALGTIGKPPAFDARTFLDAGGNWCTRGVLAGDKLQLNGCNTDADCDFQQFCVRDPAATPQVLNGLCLDREPPADQNISTDAFQKQQATLCGPLLRAVRRFRITSAQQGIGVAGAGTTDRLTLAEIYEPEHTEEWVGCTVGDPNACTMITVTGPKDITGTPMKLPTTCLVDSDGQPKCLRACTPDAIDPITHKLLETALCGVDFQCAASRKGDTRCMRAPLDDALFGVCLGELQPYEIHAGDAFTASGSASGFLVDVQPNPTTRECEVPPISSPYVRLRQSRIPTAIADLAACPPALMTAGVLGTLDNSFASNACLFTPPDPAATRRIHFENPYFAIGLELPPGRDELTGEPRTLPPDAFSISFVVVGGGFPASFPIGVDVPAQQPRVVITAPDRQTIYVLDEGKQTTTTGLRGQLLRVSTSTQTTDRTFLVR